jgi:acyl-CoA thioester hydrolase
MNDPAPERLVAETLIQVRSYELDSFGHANHAVFLNWFEYGRFDALRQGGFPYQSLRARGWGVYVVRIEVDYLKEARLDDRLRIRTWAESRKRSSLLLAQEMIRDDEPSGLVARARVTAVWVGPDRRPMRVPPEVCTALGIEDDDDATHP